MNMPTLFNDDVMAQAAIDCRTPAGKDWLFKALLQGHFIMERGGKSKTFTHCLFRARGEPVRKISRHQWKRIKPLMKYRKTSYGMFYTLHLGIVRGLHGNRIEKKLYRKFKTTKPHPTNDQ